ncbi:MAG: hypothetical protein AB1646_13080 [Thermodesulfobacteriota bacterium]
MAPTTRRADTGSAVEALLINRLYRQKTSRNSGIAITPTMITLVMSISQAFIGVPRGYIDGSRLNQSSEAKEAVVTKAGKTVKTFAKRTTPANRKRTPAGGLRNKQTIGYSMQVLAVKSVMSKSKRKLPSFIADLIHVPTGGVHLVPHDGNTVTCPPMQLFRRVVGAGVPAGSHQADRKGDRSLRMKPGEYATEFAHQCLAVRRDDRI